MTSNSLKPLRLHTMIGGSTEWTDELWGEVLQYLVECVGSTGAVLMAERLHRERRLPKHLNKADYFQEFRNYPPTVLLGELDYVRLLVGEKFNRQ